MQQFGYVNATEKHILLIIQYNYNALSTQWTHIIDKHINLGLQAISKHKQRETTLWDAYIERLLALQNK